MNTTEKIKVHEEAEKILDNIHICEKNIKSYNESLNGFGGQFQDVREKFSRCIRYYEYLKEKHTKEYNQLIEIIKPF